MELNYNLCGLLNWHPNWLQTFATSKIYLLIYGLLGTTQAMATIYFTSVMTTIEKRFQIPGYLMGLILCGNEISQILLSLILSYLGGQRNRPRWISIGVFFCALSCFVLALPHALYGGGDEALKYTEEYGSHLILNATELVTLHKRNHGLCMKDSEISEKCKITEPYITPLLLIFLSQFVLGIGNSLYYSLGQTYLDDNVKKTKTPMLLGWALFLKTLGPGFGFVLGYTSLRVYIDPTKTPKIDYKDPRWLGWIILGAVMTIFSILVGMFPKELPENSSKTKNVNSNEETKICVCDQLKDSIPAFKRLIKNKILVFNTLSSFFAILGSNSYLVFLAKYIETQFHKKRSDSSIITGPISLLGMALGFLLSGILISKFKPRAKYVLMYNVIVGALYIFGHIGNLFLFCSTAEDKLLANYFNTKSSKMTFNLTRDCNLNCNCETISGYNPVCTTTGHVDAYFSPCYAGCENFDEDSKVFSECACLEYTKYLTKVSNNRNLLGSCVKECGYGFLIFTSIAAINNFLSASGRIGNTLVNYRCISIQDKSSAQGFILMIASLGSMLSPIIFANIIDSTCLIWTENCGKRGSCQLYDQALFLFSTIAVILDFFTFSYGKETLKIYGDVKEDKDEVISKTVETALVIFSSLFEGNFY
uniref:Solute carrier organic anion transporter family member n=1 Tax=Culicoides sonorensis TaxID=179676 RepID=A0A336M5S4_CULSO